MQNKYKSDENQFVSSMNMIDRSDGYERIYYKDDPRQGVVAIGFVTPLFSSLVNCTEYIQEYFIDSTYKTNRLGAELFGIIANVNGVGYPLGYMLYSKTAAEVPADEENAKAITIREWFIEMKDRGFDPKFFFSDKDAPTMQAIKVVFGERRLRLCLWHLKRSVVKKLSSQKLQSPSYTAEDANAASVALGFDVSDSFLPSAVPRTGIICAISLRNEIRDLMGKHYHMHPLIPTGFRFRSAREIHRLCCEEMYNFCFTNNLPDAWAYLYKRWYCSDRWDQWARSSFPGTIPAGKTTMFIESHWKTMKRYHLYRFNRARLDLLTYVIIEKHCRQLLYCFHRDVLQRASTTLWESNFCTDWNKCVTRAVQPMNQYYTNVDNWICGCPAFILSRRLICKHLVSQVGIGKIAPRERFIIRRTTMPYIEISEKSPRVNTYNVFRELQINDGRYHPVVELRRRQQPPSSPSPAPSSPSPSSPSPSSPSPSPPSPQSPSIQSDQPTPPPFSPNFSFTFSPAPSSPTFTVASSFAVPNNDDHPVDINDSDNENISVHLDNNDDPPIVNTGSDDEQRPSTQSAQEQIVFESDERHRLERAMHQNRQEKRSLAEQEEDLIERLREVREAKEAKDAAYSDMSLNYQIILAPAQRRAYQNSVNNGTDLDYLNSVTELARRNTIPVTRTLNSHNLRR